MLPQPIMRRSSNEFIAQVILCGQFRNFLGNTRRANGAGEHVDFPSQRDKLGL